VRQRGRGLARLRGEADQRAAEVGPGPDLADPAGVGEQVADRDGRRAAGRLDADVAQPLRDRVVEAEAALLDELHHGDRGHRLRDRADAEHRAGVHRPARLRVGEAEADEAVERAVADDADGQTGERVLVDRLDGQALEPVRIPRR
jgi:hypothetical protein